jgi:hypothetical protein
MADPVVVAFFVAHPDAMAAFDRLANRCGQSIEAAIAPAGYGFDGCVVVRYSRTRDPVGVIYPDGRTEEVPE